eukprot:scaffold1444_cov185-Skeletonema_menzelii.AAC.3
MGGAECIRGIFAFFACPLFGKLSDVWGRRPCLFITVMGTLAPVCSLAFWKPEGGYDHSSSVDTTDVADTMAALEAESILDGVDAGDASPGGSRDGLFQSSLNQHPPISIYLVAAYGLALATFGLSFTVGPLLGGYLANVDDEGKGQGGRSFFKLLKNDDNESSSSPEHYEQSSGDIHPIGQHR